MRSAVRGALRSGGWLASMAALGVVVTVACGGGGVPGVEGPKVPDVPGAGVPEAGVPSTTTTVMLGDGGELTGTKLTSNSTLTVDNSAKDAGPPGPGDTLGKTDVPGRRPQDLMTIISGHRDEARACYDAALKAHPGIEGNLDIKFTIDPKGAVTDGAADEGKSDIHEPGVVTCIVGVLKKIKFAEHPKGFETRAHYPFNFHPHGAPKKP